MPWPPYGGRSVADTRRRFNVEPLDRTEHPSVQRPVSRERRAGRGKAHLCDTPPNGWEAFGTRAILVRLFNETRRRRVLKVVAGYVVACWGIIQLVALLTDEYDVSSHPVRWLFVVALVGFPVVFALSWKYDLGPITGDARFTFGIRDLNGGLDFIAVIIGLFGIAELLDQLLTHRQHNIRPISALGRWWPNRAEVRQIVRPTGIGGIVGLVVGIIPGAGATQRLPRAIGRQNAMYALLTGLPMSAADAHRLGYVSEVVEGDAIERAVELAALIASRPRLAVRQIKEVVRLGLDTSFEAGIALERRGYQLMFGTQDLREGFASIREGREPKFTGD